MPDTSAGATNGAHRQTETERKFALLPGAEVPDLGALAAVGEPTVVELSATYIDSPSFELNRARITLRRRTGGADEAWHLKLPSGDSGRVELHVPLADSDDPMLVPRELRMTVNEQVGHVALVPVALLETRRTLRVLTDPATGTPLAELADDTVTATRMPLPGVSRTSSTWRELEVELLEGGDLAFLDAVTEKLQWAGIVPSHSPSKVTQALGDAPTRAAEYRPSTKDPMLDTVMRALAVHVGVLQGREQAVAEDAPDAVHKARVASRRLRSILRVFRDLFDPEAVQSLREELKWYATELGHARDAEVQKARLLAQVEALPEEAVVGPVRERMETELEAAHQRALAGVTEALADKRYRALMVALGQFLVDPPVMPGTDGPVDELAVALVDKAIKKVRRAHRHAEDSEGQERLEALHEVRKKAKVVRYACEALVPVYGEDAASSARDWEAVTEVFGEMNDAVVAREHLLELSRAATAAGEPSFTYGVLYGTQMGNLDRDLPEARAALKRAVRRGPDSWRG